MRPSISTQTLAKLLGLPLNSTPLLILEEIGSLIAFRNNHTGCKDGLKTISNDLIRINQLVQTNMVNYLRQKIQKEEERIQKIETMTHEKTACNQELDRFLGRLKEGHSIHQTAIMQHMSPVKKNGQQAVEPARIQNKGGVNKQQEQPQLKTNVNPDLSKVSQNFVARPKKPKSKVKNLGITYDLQLD